MNYNYFKYFDSVAAFDDFLANAPVQSAWKRKGIERSHEVSKYRTEFTMTGSYEEANRLLMFGDETIADKINASGFADNKIKIEKERKKRIFRSALVGHAPNVANYVAGVPNSMIRTENSMQKQKIITIAYMPVYSWTQTQDEIIRAGVEFLSAVLMLESAGYVVNLLCALYIKGPQKNNNSSCVSVVKIKDSDQRIDVLNIAYPMCHPSYLRRHGFRFIEIMSTRVWGAYGKAGNFEVEASIALKANNIPCDMVISYCGIKGLTKEQILKKYFSQDLKKAV